MPYPVFDRTRLILKPLSERVHDMTLADIISLEASVEPFENSSLDQVAKRITKANRSGSQVILMMGAHVIKRGLSRFVIDLMERGLVSHIGTNGAGAITIELALIGATTESVAHYIQAGQFGLWEETSIINTAITKGVNDELGFGESVGRMIHEDQFPHREISILAAGYRLRIPVTVHVGVGYDIINEHPNCNGADLGFASYRDFLIITESIAGLQGGVLLNFGTSVMGPEVYLKSLSMARNVALQDGKKINQFTTALFDLIDLGSDIHQEAPKTEARYYYRPYKTILVRTVQDGGESFYIQGDHQATLPKLHELAIQFLDKE